jgi:dihydrofolate reductase
MVFTLPCNEPPKLPMVEISQLLGGVSTIRQYLSAGLIEEMHLAIAPILLGSGEHLLAAIDTPKLGYRCTEHVTTANATHVVLPKGS